MVRLHPRYTKQTSSILRLSSLVAIRRSGSLWFSFALHPTFTHIVIRNSVSQFSLTATTHSTFHFLRIERPGVLSATATCSTVRA
jgi:hypothetical protein